MNQIKCKDLFRKSEIDYIDSFIFSKEYPWELLPLIKPYIEETIKRGIELSLLYTNFMVLQGYLFQSYILF